MLSPIFCAGHIRKVIIERVKKKWATITEEIECTEKSSHDGSGTIVLRKGRFVRLTPGWR